MKRIHIVAMLCLVVAVSVVSAAGASAPIGVDTAKERAQDFLNAPDATVQYQKTERLNLGEYYVFGTGDGQIYVNARTGAVERATFDSARKDSRDVRLDRAAAEATARAYAEEKYSGFGKKNMRLTRSDLVSHGDAGSEYSYIWREEISGVLTPNTVVVNLNPSTGEIISYLGIQREIECSLEPKLSRDEALKIAAGQFPGIRVTNATADLSVEYTRPDAQTLTWVITIRGEPVDHVLQGGLVIIDAQTGEVLMVSPYL
ncbi:PepSY domain-containing protein [Methanoculleus sp. UBA208]|uniref:PepSY domain-containing protein n=1 Tax=Methanoculleus sp. UBA208 TaxID=1915494 RepID=UPI0025CF44E0|nr:PepSY domain-containing protein [Methanoculleus sp. UBA208]